MPLDAVEAQGPRAQRVRGTGGVTISNIYSDSLSTYCAFAPHGAARERGVESVTAMGNRERDQYASVS